MKEKSGAFRERIYSLSDAAEGELCQRGGAQRPQRGAWRTHGRRSVKSELMLLHVSTQVSSIPS